MTQKSVELVFVIDMSGSMSGLEKDTIGGFNSTIEKQSKEEGEVTVSTVLFNTQFKTIHDRIALGSVKRMTEKDYYPSGGTAMLDAIGNAIQHISEVHSHMKEESVPEKTMFVIITDGQENSSREFTYKKVKGLIEAKRESGWEFVFLGANIDAAAEAERMGIDRRCSAEYHCDGDGLEASYGCIDDSICYCRNDICLCESDWNIKVEKDNKRRRSA